LAAEFEQFIRENESFRDSKAGFARDDRKKKINCLEILEALRASQPVETARLEISGKN
jgi:hypothetical protein